MRLFHHLVAGKTPRSSQGFLKVGMEALDGLFIYVIRTRLFDMVFRYNAAAIYRKSGKSVPVFGYFTQAEIHK